MGSHSPCHVLMIGPHETRSLGGMAAVVACYRQAGLMNEGVTYLASYVDGSMRDKFLCFWNCMARLIFALLFQRSIRILHLHVTKRGSFLRKSIILFLGRLAGKQVIFHIHADGIGTFYFERSRPFQRFISWVFRFPTMIIALSNAWKTELEGISHRPDIQVLWNPVPLQPQVNLERQQTGCTFLFMGRMGERKGLYVLLEAAKKLKGKAIRLVLYGDGEVDRIKAQVEKEKLGDIVQVAGWISGDQKRQAFEGADGLILPSYSEGLPMAVLEAMSYGLPVISTPVGGTIEALQDGLNGFLVPPGDADALAQRIDALAASQPLRIQMGRAGYRWIQTRFEAARIIGQLQAFYCDLISARP